MMIKENEVSNQLLLLSKDIYSQKDRISHNYHTKFEKTNARNTAKLTRKEKLMEKLQMHRIKITLHIFAF